MKVFKLFSRWAVTTLFILSMSLLAAAQAVPKAKEGPLSLLKGKTKVLLLDADDLQRVIDYIQANSNLIVVKNRLDADFVLSFWYGEESDSFNTPRQTGTAASIVNSIEAPFSTHPNESTSRVTGARGGMVADMVDPHFNHLRVWNDTIAVPIARGGRTSYNTTLTLSTDTKISLLRSFLADLKKVK
jgi:hypothetical protein